MTNAIMTT